VQRAAAQLDPQVAVTGPRTMSGVVAASMSRRSFVLMLLAAAALLSLVLSAVGLYAVVSYVVSQRLGEIGIRLALGARASQVARLVVGQSLALAALGVALGVGTALAVTRVLGSLLYEVRPRDPGVLAAVAALLVLISLLASLAPTWRAVRVDPSQALRGE
jgi:ABC-type antimicrobial peptide transport system permease subunit